MLESHSAPAAEARLGASHGPRRPSRFSMPTDVPPARGTREKRGACDPGALVGPCSGLRAAGVAD